MSIFTKFFSVCNSSDAIWCLAISALLPILLLLLIVPVATLQGVVLAVVAKPDGFLISALFGPKTVNELMKQSTKEQLLTGH